MSSPTEFYNWWVVDERTGELQLTPYKLTCVDATRAFGNAQPNLASREVRNLISAGEALANSRPGGNWSRWN